jgi:hypothetical protein
MQIDLLYFNGCPSWQDAEINLKTALKRESIDAQIRLIHVENDFQAAQLKFLGSPSFQVDGQDLWPEQRTSYHLSCRVYSTPSGIRGIPSVEMFQDKLRGS